VKKTQNSKLKTKNKTVIFINAMILTMLISLYPSAVYPYTEQDLAHVEKLFMEEKYDKAAEEASGLIESKARQRDELYYLKGLSEMKMSRFDDARQSFGDLMSKYPNSRRAFDANVGIGDTYYLQNNPYAAISIYNDALKKFPGDSNVKIVYDRIDQCHRKVGISASPVPPDMNSGKAAVEKNEEPNILTRAPKSNFVPKSNFGPRRNSEPKSNFVPKSAIQPKDVHENEARGSMSVQVGCF